MAEMEAQERPPDEEPDPLLTAEYINLVPGLELERRIGVGATSLVYLAHDKDSPSQKYAVKMLTKVLVLEDEARKRWEREVRILMSLDHPNIVRGVRAGLIETRPYIVMEYLQGETLEERVKRIGPMDSKELYNLAESTLLALNEAHQRNIVHRDIKPANLFRLSDGRLKVTDFGLARMLEDESLTLSGNIVGTPLYISPEQACGDGVVTFASDIYSLGVTLFFLACGHPPFDGLSGSLLLTRKVTDEVPDPREYMANLDDGIVALIQRFCQRRREVRPQSAEDALKLYYAARRGELSFALFASNEEAARLNPVVPDLIPKDREILESFLDDPFLTDPPRGLDAGQVLFYEEDTSRECYILIAGALEVLKAGRRISVVDQPGAFIGEMAVLRGTPRSTTVIAREPSFLLCIPEHEFQDFFMRNPALGLAMARSLANQLEVSHGNLLRTKQRLIAIDRVVRELTSLVTEP